ncbi:MAG: serine hydrolase [Xenococcaceae cyanobacterium]
MNREVAIMNQTEVPENLEHSLETALLQVAQDTNTSDIGVTVGVVTPEGTWTGATGVSNLEIQQATQPDDLFNIGSISKPYTSAVILKLQEQGKLSLDDTIDKWLPEIAANITNGDNLTIRQILNGTGGLWDYLNGDDEFLSELIADYLSGSNRDWQPEELVAYAFGKPLFSGEFSTETWTYTNTGNIIAALIAESATGKPFKEILAEEILSPLGLNNTFFTTEDVSLEQRARGYEDIFTADGTIGVDGILEDYTIVNTEIAYSPGSIVSSAEDVAIFFNSLASGDLLQPESTAEIFNYVNTGLTEIDNFGLGVYPSDYPWGETRSMSGGIFGYTSEVDYFLNSDTTISVLVNQRSLRSGLVRLAYKASIANSLGLNDDSAINGTEADDYLTGTSNNDVINGKEGDDIPIGKKGLDAIDGGVGDDLIEGGEGDDVLFGKEGDDNLYGGKDDDFLNGGVGDDLLTGNRGFDNLIGGDGQDTLLGGKDDDILSGGAGDDLVRDTQGNNAFYGNDGDDLLFAGKGDDVLYGDAGSDRLIASAGADQLFGGSEDDYLNGGEGDDRLFGGEGDDTLIGLSGSNTLTGGDGSDRALLSLDGTDTITDFTNGEDFLELPETISFAELEIIQGTGDNADNTLITFESETLAILNNINSWQISQSDFENNIT